MIEPVCDDKSNWFYGPRYPIDWSQLIIDYDATPQQPERFERRYGKLDSTWAHAFKMRDFYEEDYKLRQSVAGCGGGNNFWFPLQQ